MVPKFPIPLTIAILAARFDGGRGIELDTQTDVKANPSKMINTYFPLNVVRLQCLPAYPVDIKNIPT